MALSLWLLVKPVDADSDMMDGLSFYHSLTASTLPRNCINQAICMLQVEASQSMIRVVGLSATLPNYADVANFLGVNVETGLFYFAASYRPVPLEMQFIGVNEKNPLGDRNIQDDVCYDKVLLFPANKVSRYHQTILKNGKKPQWSCKILEGL